MGGDEAILQPPRSRRCSILLTFEKVNELGHCDEFRTAIMFNVVLRADGCP